MTPVVTVTFTAKEYKHSKLTTLHTFFKKQSSSSPVQKKEPQTECGYSWILFSLPTSNSTPLLPSGYKNLTVQSNIISSGAGDDDNVVY